MYQLGCIWLQVIEVLLGDLNNKIVMISHHNSKPLCNTYCLPAFVIYIFFSLVLTSFLQGTCCMVPKLQMRKLSFRKVKHFAQGQGSDRARTWLVPRRCGHRLYPLLLLCHGGGWGLGSGLDRSSATSACWVSVSTISLAFPSKLP